MSRALSLRVGTCLGYAEHQVHDAFPLGNAAKDEDIADGVLEAGMDRMKSYFFGRVIIHVAQGENANCASGGIC